MEIMSNALSPERVVGVLSDIDESVTMSCRVKVHTKTREVWEL